MLYDYGVDTLTRKFTVPEFALDSAALALHALVYSFSDTDDCRAMRILISEITGFLHSFKAFITTGGDNLRAFGDHLHERREQTPMVASLSMTMIAESLNRLSHTEQLTLYGEEIDILPGLASRLLDVCRGRPAFMDAIADLDSIMASTAHSPAAPPTFPVPAVPQAAHDVEAQSPSLLSSSVWWSHRASWNSASDDLSRRSHALPDAVIPLVSGMSRVVTCESDLPGMLAAPGPDCRIVELGHHTRTRARHIDCGMCSRSMSSGTSESDKLKIIPRPS